MMRLSGCVVVALCVAGVLAVSAQPSYSPSPAPPPSWRWISSPDIHEIIVGGSAGWTIKKYRDITGVTVGDMLVFRWSGSNTVHRVRSKSCDFNGAVFLQSTNNVLESFGGFNPPSSFEFKYRFDKKGTFYFADELSNNCEQGMLFKVVVS